MPVPLKMNGEFEFQFPWLLALLGLLPVYALLRGKAGKLSALTFSSADIARAAGAQARAAAGRFLFFLRLLAVALGIVALAGPRLANYHVETETPGIDIMLVLDLSWSMEAIDMGKPAEKLSRFAIASGVLKDFIGERPNDRIGLIAFSGVPYLASPLTLNHDWLIENLQRLHVGIITDLGTAIGDAVAVAAQRLKAVPNSKSRVMILLTDGDNNLGKIDPLPAAQLAAALGVKIYAIGIGIEAAVQYARVRSGDGTIPARSRTAISFRRCCCSRRITPCWAKWPRCPADSFIARPTSANCKTFTTRLIIWKNPRSSCGGLRPISRCLPGRCSPRSDCWRWK